MIARIFLNGALVLTSRVSPCNRPPDPRPDYARANDEVSVVFHAEHPTPNERPLVATARLEPLG